MKDLLPFLVLTVVSFGCGFVAGMPKARNKPEPPLTPELFIGEDEKEVTSNLGGTMPSFIDADPDYPYLLLWHYPNGMVLEFDQQRALAGYQDLPKEVRVLP